MYYLHCNSTCYRIWNTTRHLFRVQNDWSSRRRGNYALWHFSVMFFYSCRHCSMLTSDPFLQTGMLVLFMLRMGFSETRCYPHLRWSHREPHVYSRCRPFRVTSFRRPSYLLLNYTSSLFNLTPSAPESHLERQVPTDSPRPNESWWRRWELRIRQGRDGRDQDHHCHCAPSLQTCLAQHGKHSGEATTSSWPDPSLKLHAALRERFHFLQSGWYLETCMLSWPASKAKSSLGNPYQSFSCGLAGTMYKCKSCL